MFFRHEAMIDLCHLLSKLVDSKGRILIPGINELVKPITEEECNLYDEIDFDPSDFAKDIGTDRLIHHGDRVKHLTLQHRWRYPSLSIHGKYFLSYQSSFSIALIIIDLDHLSLFVHRVNAFFL